MSAGSTSFSPFYVVVVFKNTKVLSSWHIKRKVSIEQINVNMFVNVRCFQSQREDISLQMVISEPGPISTLSCPTIMDVICAI